MRSIGIELAPFVKRGLLQFYAIRPYHHGLESHLVEMHDQMGKLKPSVVVMDPVTNLMSVAADNEVKGMLTRLIDYLKMQHITALFTSLTQGDHVEEQSEVGISSLMDTWISLKNVEQNGERNRVLQVLKSRGMSHSNQVREFQMSREGLELLDVYRGSNEVLTGSARLAQEARERAESRAREQQIARLKRARDRKETAAQARMAAIQAELMEDMEEISRSLSEETARSLSHSRQLQAMGRKRMADRKPQPGPVRNMEGNGRIK
jgi:circadian clock protein KaiC